MNKTEVQKLVFDIGAGKVPDEEINVALTEVKAGLVAESIISYAEKNGKNLMSLLEAAHSRHMENAVGIQTLYEMGQSKESLAANVELPDRLRQLGAMFRSTNDTAPQLQDVGEKKGGPLLAT